MVNKRIWRQININTILWLMCCAIRLSHPKQLLVIEKTALMNAVIMSAGADTEPAVPEGTKQGNEEEAREASDVSTVATSSEEEYEPPLFRAASEHELPPEFRLVQKLVKNMKSSNHTATLLTLRCLADQDLKDKIIQSAIREGECLELLINLIETDNLNCQLGALLILSKISSSRSIKKSILDFEGVLPLVNILSCPARDLQILAAETIQNIASMRQVRKLVRQYGGIPILVDLLDINPTALQFPVEALSPEDVKQVEVARNSIKALWTLSVSNRNKKEMLKANCVPLFAKLFRSVHPDIIIPTAGILQECALEKSYQSAFENHGMIADFVQYLFSESAELKKHSASAIFRCAEGDITRNMVRLADGLYILVKLAKTIKVHPDRLLLAAVTGAIWKCALNSENVQRFDELEAVEVLIAILQDEYRELHSFCLVTRNPICRKECFLPEILEVLTNVIGGLSQFAKLSHNREALREARVVPLLVELLFESKEDLLENVAHLLGECAKEKESMAIIEELDGVSLLWSLLKNPSTNVQANAAWALCPCLENSKDAGEMVKSIPGSMLIAIRLLRTSNDTNVLAGVCAVLARIALDKENLAIITDHGVATVLAKHVTTEEDIFRENLAQAIANVSAVDANRYEIGRLGCIPVIVNYLVSKNQAVCRAAANALFQLSAYPLNCQIMQQSGVLPYLIVNIECADEKLREASAGCMANIRKVVK
ncbi:armadillo repeat-containing protein gudu-like [Schistocerca americana]|uniref:armadillo repeat-containing protein gudu-like n=1 Tax=Schistocerca americana TaxID=7009 RepID=UPI001F4F7336|nr:armadillo repeat-containing protein gudu-like [Schistocerca americana]